MKNLAAKLELYAVYVLRSDGKRSHFIGYTWASCNANATKAAYIEYGNPYGYDAEPADPHADTSAANVF